MQDDLEKLVTLIKTEFSKDAGEISEAIALLSLTLDGLLEHTSIALAQSQRERNFGKSKELVSFAERISEIQSEVDQWCSSLQDEGAAAQEDEGHDAEDDEEEGWRDGSLSPNYAQYQVNQSIPHTLYESFTHKKVCAFSFRGKTYSVKDWKALLVQTCDLLHEIDPDKMMRFLSDGAMVGSRIHYFGTKYVPYKNVKLAKTDLYVWVHLSSNGKRNIIRKMLKKYNIPLAEFVVFLRADYTPLHPNYREDAVAVDAPPDDEKIGGYVRSAMRELSEQGIALSKADLSLMLSKEGTKRLFDVDYPLLKPFDDTCAISPQISENGYRRYWKEIFLFNGNRYLVTSQWRERSRDLFAKWLSVTMRDYS